MTKIEFTPVEGFPPEEFYIIHQTVWRGHGYILVSAEDPEEDDFDGEVFILRDDSDKEERDALYSAVEDDEELKALGDIFRRALSEEDITLEE